MAASEAEAMPLPKKDTTPPVTKIRGGEGGVESFFRFRRWVKSLVGPKLSLKLHRLFD